MASFDLPLDNDYGVVAGPGTELDLTTGGTKPFIGPTVTALISATEQPAHADTGADTPIDASLEITLGATNVAGRWAGVFQGADLRAHLASYVGQTVYVVIRSGSDYRKPYAHHVRDPRRTP